MHVFRRRYDVLPDFQGSVIALGNFDGVHLGHRKVVALAVQQARVRGGGAGVLTFDPHPRRLLQPDAPPFALSSLAMKIRLIEELGIDWLLAERFDAAFAGQSAETFVCNVLRDGVKAGMVVVGEGFCFGRNRGGSVEVLRRTGQRAGFDVVTVPRHDEDGTAIPCSSSGIRDALTRGDPRAAAAILGRPWEIDGVVEHGDARGRTIGFPTANMRLGDYQRPACGVYAVQAGIGEGEATRWHSGVANFGRRPTFDGDDELLEVHLFDFDGDLYDALLRVRFIDFIRPERKFSGIEALVEQIGTDAASARRILGCESDGAPRGGLLRRDDA